MTKEFLLDYKTKSAEIVTAEKKKKSILQSICWVLLCVLSSNWCPERIQEREKTWFSVGCDLSSVLVLQLNSSSKTLKMLCSWVCVWSCLYIWVCPCILKGSNETKPESHCRILLITNLLWDISLRVWIRGPTSGNLCACLARSFYCFLWVNCGWFL